MVTAFGALRPVGSETRTPKELYLELLKGCLTRNVIGERYRPLLHRLRLRAGVVSGGAVSIRSSAQHWIALDLNWSVRPALTLK